MYNYVKKNTPSISCVMYVYNNQDTLKESITSLIEQTFDDFELIICDDGSTDNSNKIIQEVVANQENIDFISRKESLGKYYTLNQMQKLVNGRIVMHVDANEYSTKDRLLRTINFFDTNKKISVCGHQVGFKDKDLIKKLPTDPLSIKFLLLPFGVNALNNICAKKEILDKFPYKQSYDGFSEYEFLINVSSNSKHQISNMQETLSFSITQTKENISHEDIARKLNASLKCFSKFYNIKVSHSIRTILDNTSKIKQQDLTLAKQELQAIASLLNERYEKKYNLDLGSLFLKQFDFLKQCNILAA